ncbi:hypothetical protein [Mannheimia indoligenes]|uniref:hypothetical protein n=1 Tax=Mannheimia indoligenes TaxID=3103145 RepID=UPI002FE67AF5
MADNLYKSQLLAKITQFEQEKEQVLAHLTLLDRRIDLLHQALEVMEVDAKDIAQFDTENFQYRIYRKRFNGKLSQLIQKVMKMQPERFWRAEELTEAVLVADKQIDTEVAPHLIESIRSAMAKLVRKGIVERIVIEKNKNIQWKWIQK